MGDLLPPPPGGPHAEQRVVEPGNLDRLCVSSRNPNRNALASTREYFVQHPRDVLAGEVFEQVHHDDAVEGVIRPRHNAAWCQRTSRHACRTGDRIGALCID